VDRPQTTIATTSRTAGARAALPALLTAFAAFGCYQSYAEFADGDHDTHASPDDARPDVRDDGALPDFGPEGEAEVAADADADADADGDADVDADADADADVRDGGFVPCAGGWFDPVSGLCWQDPPYDLWADWSPAAAYCDGLLSGGLGPGSWYLPTINELRSLIRGCPSTETGGTCGVTESCLDWTCLSDPCRGCPTHDGPGTGGCFWDAAFAGECGIYWSSSDTSLIPGGASVAWRVFFQNGGVDYYDKTYEFHVRCVRPGP
jgi:hypothetical protein